jgi:hypothetical protein
VVRGSTEKEVEDEESDSGEAEEECFDSEEEEDEDEEPDGEEESFDSVEDEEKEVKENNGTQPSCGLVSVEDIGLVGMPV